MTRCALLLSLLEDAGERGITTSEILQAGVGSRYGARLMELRKQGHRITSERVREGSWKYTLAVVAAGNGGAIADAAQRAVSSPSEHPDRQDVALKLFESAA